MTHFDEEPDGDPHGECRAEITRLGAALEAMTINCRRLIQGINDEDGDEQSLAAEALVDNMAVPPSGAGAGNTFEIRKEGAAAPNDISVAAVPERPLSDTKATGDRAAGESLTAQSPPPPSDSPTSGAGEPQRAMASRFVTKLARCGHIAYRDHADLCVHRGCPDAAYQGPPASGALGEPTKFQRAVQGAREAFAAVREGRTERTVLVREGGRAYEATEDEAASGALGPVEGTQGPYPPKAGDVWRYERTGFTFTGLRNYLGTGWSFDHPGLGHFDDKSFTNGDLVFVRSSSPPSGGAAAPAQRCVTCGHFDDEGDAFLKANGCGASGRPHSFACPGCDKVARHPGEGYMCGFHPRGSASSGAAGAGEACPGYCAPPGEACAKPCALVGGHGGRCSCSPTSTSSGAPAEPGPGEGGS